MKILNLYAGIGGNRKLWGDGHEITAIEYDPEIAAVYKKYFPGDNVIIADAHKYLLGHYRDGFDFIWASPPCPSHSRLQLCMALSDTVRAGHVNRTAIYPDMSLYQEIILLQSFAPKKTKWVIENVLPYYKPLIDPSIELGRHLFWNNFYIEGQDFKKEKNLNEYNGTESVWGFSVKNEKIENKRKVMRNMVNPEIGKYIFDQAFNYDREKQQDLFSEVAK